MILFRNHFFFDPAYAILRRDRFRDGGGLLVLIKKNLKLIKSESSVNFEAIKCEFSAFGSIVNILFVYKPPSTNNKDFLDFLESFILSTNTNDRFLIIGDLNMDHITGDNRFSEFLDNFNLKTLTDQPTRIGVKNQFNGEINVKLSMIDHIIHQNDLKPTSQIVGCPFSDHKFLLGAFN